MRTLPCIFAMLACSLSGVAFAHEGPEHEIEELTERIQQTGETAGLLTERAIEYRVLGKLAEATKDLERALVLEPDSIGIRRELGRVHFMNGKASDALSVIARGLSIPAEEPADLASLWMLRAEIYRSQKEHAKALDDCNAALRVHKQNPEWYLLRSDVQRRMKSHKERIAGIEEGIRETGAGILEIERVEALLDAGHFAEALKIVEVELADSRIKSSWLIRRAKAYMGLGKKDAATEDLKDAMEEIQSRLNPKMPDGPLLLDKALIHELLGEKREALRAYEEARDKGASEAFNVGDKIKSLQEPGDVSAEPEKEKKPSE